jgi:hypothetical protein
VVRTAGTLYGKVSLADAWVKLTTGASGVRVSGSRITYTDTTGNVWAKDGLYGTWYKEYGPVSQYAASGFNSW